MKIKKNIFSHRIALIFFLFIFASRNIVYCLNLTIEESIKLALKNNFDVQIESQELENRISEVTKEKAYYIPWLELKTSYSHENDTPDIAADSQDEHDYSAAIVQDLPLGGVLSLSYSTGKTSISSYESEITRYRIGQDFMIDSFIESTIIPGEDIHFSEVDLTYQQPLLKGGLAAPAFAEIKDARFDHDIQETIIDDLQINLVSEVKTAYYRLVRQQRATEINKEILAISDNILNLIHARFEMGRVAELESMSARVQRNKNRQAYLLSCQNLQVAQKTLQNLLGIDLLIKANDNLEKEVSIPNTNYVISTALQQNKQLLSIKQQIAKTELAVKVSKNQILPQVDLFASVISVGQGDSYSRAGNMKGKEYKAGLLISYPFNNIALTEDLKQTRRDLKKLKLRLKDQETKVINLSSQLVNELNLLQKRIDVYDEQLEITKERIDLALKAFNQGLIIASLLYDAQDDLFDAENLYLSVLLERIQKLSELQSLMGLGYSG